MFQQILLRSIKSKGLFLLCFLFMGNASIAATGPEFDGYLIRPSHKKTANLVAELKKMGVTIERKLRTKMDEIYFVKNLGQDQVSVLQDSPNIEVIEPNYIYKLEKPELVKMLTAAEVAKLSKLAAEENTDGNLPNDPMFGQLWGLKNTGNNVPRLAQDLLGVAGADLDVVKAWDITKGSRAIKVAIIDTGIDFTHPDLVKNIFVNTAELNGKPGVDDDGNGFVDDVYGYNFADATSIPMDGHGHGTHVAGTIGAVHNNGVGVAGVMADVQLVAVKFLGDNGSGSLEHAIESIDYATGLDVDIMSNSWGGGGFSSLLKDAIQRANDKGIVFTAAAGNDGTNNDSRPHYPSNYEVPNVVSVAAYDISNKLASFSCYGRDTVHVAAPGKDILSTVKDNSYAIYSGTSMATPHATGAIGLLLAQEGRIDFAELRERLIKTSVPVASMRSKLQGKGRLSAYNLLTNTRVPNDAPNAGDWKIFPLTEVFSSQHPYVNDANVSKSVQVPGARYLRVVVKKYDLESDYDFLKIVDPKGNNEVEKISGAGENYTSDYVEGDSVLLQFTSDRSVSKWGFEVEKVEYVL